MELDRLGWSWSKCEWGRQPSSNSASEIPVLECGVKQYENRKRDMVVSMGIVGSAFLITVFKICTARSANPLVAGWYGALVM